MDFVIPVPTAVRATIGWALNSPSYLPIVPGGAGWGFNQYGGSGRHLGTPSTTVLYVDTLDGGVTNTDATHGSLRWALTRSGPRIIIPTVDGIIDWAGSRLDCFNPYFSFWGHCAPGEGLFVKGAGIGLQSNDQVIMHLTVIPSVNTEDVNYDSFNLQTGSGHLLYNCAGMWSGDENYGIIGIDHSRVAGLHGTRC